MFYYLQGLLLGFAYVAPIGVQNLYVINSALSGKLPYALKVAFITVFFDVTLALACFIGIGIFIERFALIKIFMMLAGSIALIIIGGKLLVSKPEVAKKQKTQPSLMQVIAACFLVTWINPQAVIDGSLLLGGYRSSLPTGYANIFIFGVTTASFLWFTGIAVMTSMFRSVFNLTVLRIINIICGSIIIFFGLKLGISFAMTI